MTTYRVEFTPGAREDILEYARYIAEQEAGSTQALAWYEGLYGAVMSLAIMPRRCPAAREQSAFDVDLRQLVHSSHRVLYSVHDDKGLVAIHRVWHGARDDAGRDDLPELGRHEL